MAMHSSTFDYLKPSDTQLEAMQHLREKTKAYAEELQFVLPEGPDKTYIMRQLRSLAMWVNVALTRQVDGSPRQDQDT